MFGSRLRAIHLLAAFFATFASGLGAPPRCSAQFVGLGTAGQYDLFEASGNLTLGGTSSSTSSSNAALGANGDGFTGQTGSVTGTFSVTNSTAPNLGSFSFTGGVLTSQSQLSTAVTDAGNAVTSATAQGTGTSFTQSGSSSVTITAANPGGQNVFSPTANISLGSGTSFTIDGTGTASQIANETFIINMGNNGLTFASGASVVLGPNVAANHVIFNMNGSGTNGKNFQFSGTGTFNGTILAKNADVSFTGGTLNGAIIQAGSHNLTFSGSGLIITATPFQAVPEPGGLLLGSIMAVVCGSVYFYRRRKVAA